MTSPTSGLRERVDWQPIATAPMNTPVLVYASNQQFVAWLQDDKTDPCREPDDPKSYLDGSWCVTDNKLGPFALRGKRPTHWMPLPEPPALAALTPEQQHDH